MDAQTLRVGDDVSADVIPQKPCRILQQIFNRTQTYPRPKKPTYNASMNPAQTSEILSLVHPLLRPWVWLQLFFLRGWVERHQRAVFILVNRYTGHIRVRFIGDAPKGENAYCYTAPVNPAWERTFAHEHLISKLYARPISVIPEYAQQICWVRPFASSQAKLDPG